MSKPSVRLLIAISFIVWMSAPTRVANSNELIKADDLSDNFSNVRITRNIASMPLSFTANQGQWDETVQFRANTGGATMWFGSDAAYYQFTRSVPNDEPKVGSGDSMYDPFDIEPKRYETIMIKASFVGANSNLQMIGVEMLEYKCNYFIGNDTNEWYTSVSNYSAVMYENIYEGIDLKYYGNGRRMEYDFIVSPGADYSQIEIKYEGAESLSINDNGELVVETKWGKVIEQRPAGERMLCLAIEHSHPRFPVALSLNLVIFNLRSYALTALAV